MKPRILTAILLFISAYSPLILILAVKDFDFDCCSYKYSLKIKSKLLMRIREFTYSSSDCHHL